MERVTASLSIHSSVTRKTITGKKTMELDLFRKKTHKFGFEYYIFFEEDEFATFNWVLNLG